MLSFYGQFGLTDRWAVGSRLDLFSVSYENYDGALTAAGYRSLVIRLEAEKDARHLKAKQTFRGPMLFMNASF